MSENVNTNRRRREAGASSKAKKKKFITRIISGVLAVLFLVTGSVFIVIGMTVNDYTNYESTAGKNTNPTSASGTNDDMTFEDITVDIYSDDLLNDPYVLNIMLFGTDNGDALSDTMILLSIDNRHQKIKMTSFLRDTYVSIPGYYPHKLNLAYALGGAPLSIQTIEQNYGVKIDRYAKVTFNTFKEIIDIMGGVEVELTADEIGYINGQVMDNGQSYDNYITEGPGMVTLNGQQALWYARNRGGTYGGVTYYGDDWDRTTRQRNFLNAVIEQMKDASLTEIVSIVNAVGPNITTDIKKTEITMLLQNALTFLNYDVEQAKMPSDGTWSYGFNEAGSVILVDDWYGARYDLATFIYEDSVVSSPAN
ncbi:MAG: LCP family protein [Eubacteriales bacterium]|nr:LCP family protein [Eubacteriales bacterium]